MSAAKPKRTRRHSDSASTPGSPTSRNWVDPDPAYQLFLVDDDAWAALAARYPTDFNTPLQRCFDVARLSGAKTAVVETRYVDLDYRSEYSAFYSRTFQTVEDSAHRIHFFSQLLRPNDLWRLPKKHGYLGYVVVRPSELGRVGRAMLVAPPKLRKSVRTAVSDVVHFFGQQLTIEAVPFVQQDAQLGRCAHAAAWMCHYRAYRRGEVARRPLAAFPLSANPGLGLGRPIPSGGMTVQQLMELLRTFDLPPAFYRVNQLPPPPDLPWPRKEDPDAPAPHPHSALIAISCRYLNSGYPVLVGTSGHAFVLCGYTRRRRGGRDWITFVRHDDQRGPYLEVKDVFDDVDPGTGDAHGPWESLVVPLPEKLWLSPEAAESQGARSMWDLAQSAHGRFPEVNTFLDTVADRDLALRTYAISANAFKEGLLDRRVDPRLALEYRMARFSRYVWVVEAIDRRLRRQRRPCVLGEAILDATSSDRLPEPLAIHVPGVAAIHRTHAPPRMPIRCSPDPYNSGGKGNP